MAVNALSSPARGAKYLQEEAAALQFSVCLQNHYQNRVPQFHRGEEKKPLLFNCSNGF